jgi:hypothetical protein
VDAELPEGPADEPSGADSEEIEKAVRAREQEELRSFQRRAQWWRSHDPDQPRGDQTDGA